MGSSGRTRTGNATDAAGLSAAPRFETRQCGWDSCSAAPISCRHQCRPPVGSLVCADQLGSVTQEDLFYRCYSRRCAQKPNFMCVLVSNPRRSRSDHQQTQVHGEDTTRQHQIIYYFRPTAQKSTIANSQPSTASCQSEHLLITKLKTLKNQYAMFKVKKSQKRR